MVKRNDSNCDNDDDDHDDTKGDNGNGRKGINERFTRTADSGGVAAVLQWYYSSVTEM
jgi:hypothetical protein